MYPSINTWSKDSEVTCLPARGWRYFLLLAGIGLALFFGLARTAQAAGFSATGSMASARQLHTATLLDTGGVLITGGVNFTASPATLKGAELYNAAGTGTFTTTGDMAVARRLHTASKLNNGTVLIAGGIDSSVLNSAEIYNPATGTFSATTGSMPAGRQLHTATLLNDGTVLITGGRSSTSSGSTLNTAVIYSPATGLFTATTGTMNLARAYHTATLLSDGKVLITGGINDGGATTATAEVYNPATGLFTATAAMTSARVYHSAVLLTDNTVLITGGAVNSSAATLNTAEIFNPAGSGSFAPTGSTMSASPGHRKHTSTLLTDGGVLIAGSEDNVPPVMYSPVSEIYAWNAELEQWFFSADYDMITARASHTATRLVNGKVLLAGGLTDSNITLASAEIFNNFGDIAQPIGAISFTPATLSVGGTTTVSALAGASGNPVIFNSTTPAICSVSGGTTVNGLAAGTCTIIANEAGNSTYSAALQTTRNITVVGLPSQTISVTTPAPGSAVYGSFFSVAATATSGLGVAITSTGSCSGSGTGSATITMTSGTGSCTVAYNQAGNGSFSAATQVTSSTTAIPTGQTIGTISFSPVTLPVGGVTTASASGGASGNPVTFSSLTPTCSVSGTNGSIVTSVSSGTCTIAANQAGNSNYSAASQVTNSLYPLTVTLAGTGSGSVNSDPAGIACTTGVCSSQFANGSIVKLMPLTSYSSLSWSGACSGSGDCLVTMNAAKSATATFTATPTVAIDGDATPYYSINAALAAIATPDKTVKALDKVFTEDVIMTSPVTIILRGGYTNLATEPPTGNTVIDGSMTIKGGTLKVDRITVK